MSKDIPIISNYKDYSPPIDVEGSVRRLLAFAKPEHLGGLRSIEITTSRGTREMRRTKLWSRGRQVAMADCRGTYHSGVIQLFVDNICEGAPRWFLRWRVFQDLAVGNVLYHELGHHIHHTKKPVHREREDVAEEWSDRLTRQYVRRKYWYWLPVFSILSAVFNRRMRPAWLFAAIIWSIGPVLRIYRVLILGHRVSPTGSLIVLAASLVSILFWVLWFWSSKFSENPKVRRTS